MNSTTLHPDILLTSGQKWAVWIAGGLLLCVSLALYLFPPQRTSTDIRTHSGARVEELRSSAADPTTLVIALASAGSILLVYGLNGIRIIRVSMSSLNLETLTAQLSNPPTSTAAEIPKPAAGAQPAAAASVDPRLVEARARFQVLDTFVRQSSWIGLKVLKACALAKEKDKPFNLRASPVVGPQSSYDYCYGYLIASFALGAVTGSADPGIGIVVIESVDPAVTATLDEYIRGNIAVAPSLSAFKSHELNALIGFFVNLK